jgi:hypothetical protein
MYESIVVGTDGSPTVQCAVVEATRLSKALGSELHVVGAYAPVRGARVVGSPEGAGRGPTLLPDTNVQAIVDEGGGYCPSERRARAVAYSDWRSGRRFGRDRRARERRPDRGGQLRDARRNPCTGERAKQGFASRSMQRDDRRDGGRSLISAMLDQARAPAERLAESRE